MWLRGSMILVAIAVNGCGGSEPPPATPAAPPPTATAHADDANRALTKGECESIGQSLAETCEKRGNTHSMQIDRWCSDLAHRLADGSWVEKECVPHVRYIDGTCLQSATNVTSAMDCEKSISP